MRRLNCSPLLFAAVVAMAGCARDSARQEGATFKTLPSDSGSLQIGYRSEPDPPREGDNNVQVTVARADGSTLSGADVSVTYFMPAMPSMNMPEMRDTFALSHEGAGTYGATVRLSMGGTWQVTVAVAQGGEALGKGRFTIIASE